MFSRHERGTDVVVRDDEGRVETMVTVTAIDGDEAQAAAIADLVREHYQTTADVFDVDQGPTMPDDLPTIAYTTEWGERRRVRYERIEGRPWEVERHVDRPDGAGGWEPCGTTVLDELVIQGEHRAAVTINEGP